MSTRPPKASETPPTRETLERILEKYLAPLPADELGRLLNENLPQLGGQQSNHDQRTFKLEIPEDLPPLLTEKEAAKILGFSVRTLQGWRLKGGGPRFVRVSATCIRYLASDLQSWVEARLRWSTSDDGADPAVESEEGSSWT